MKCTGSQFCECRECEAVKHGVKPRLPPVRVDSIVGDPRICNKCGIETRHTFCHACGASVLYVANAEAETSERSK